MDDERINQNLGRALKDGDYGTVSTLSFKLASRLLRKGQITEARWGLWMTFWAAHINQSWRHCFEALFAVRKMLDIPPEEFFYSDKDIDVFRWHEGQMIPSSLSKHVALLSYPKPDSVVLCPPPKWSMCPDCDAYIETKGQSWQVKARKSCMSCFGTGHTREHRHPDSYYIDKARPVMVRPGLTLFNNLRIGFDPKDSDLYKWAEEHGWTFDLTRRDHQYVFQVRAPWGQSTFIRFPGDDLLLPLMDQTERHIRLHRNPYWCDGCWTRFSSRLTWEGEVYLCPRCVRR